MWTVGVHVLVLKQDENQPSGMSWGQQRELLTLNDVLQCLIHGRGDADRHREAPVSYHIGNVSIPP